MDAHSRIASIWSYNEVVELGDCLKMKENEKSPLLYGVLILDPLHSQMSSIQQILQGHSNSCSQM